MVVLTAHSVLKRKHLDDDALAEIKLKLVRHLLKKSFSKAVPTVETHGRASLQRRVSPPRSTQQTTQISTGIIFKKTSVEIQGVMFEQNLLSF